MLIESITVVRYLEVRQNLPPPQKTIYKLSYGEFHPKTIQNNSNFSRKKVKFQDKSQSVNQCQAHQITLSTRRTLLQMIPMNHEPRYRMAQRPGSQQFSYSELLDKQSQSYHSRKELLKSSTKFENQNIKTLTLCNRQSQSLQPGSGSEPIKHLNLFSFKIYPCKQASCSSQKNCSYYHSPSDRRRSLIHIKYISDLCKRKDGCPDGDHCKYAHNHFESLYHPTKYKRRFCITYPQNVDNCPYGQFCSYAHSEKEIGITLLHNLNYDQDFFIFHYKTQFCPFSHISHNRSSCVYAHNWQDLRRNPYDHHIDCVQCPNWQQKQFLRFYSQGCPQGSKCPYTHGWKEYEYHPFYYRVYPCEKGENCPKRMDCPKYHDLSEKRTIRKIVSTGFFVHVPANRVVTGCFKMPLEEDLQVPSYENHRMSIEDLDHLTKPSRKSKSSSKGSKYFPKSQNADQAGKDEGDAVSLDGSEGEAPNVQQIATGKVAEPVEDFSEEDEDEEEQEAGTVDN